MNLCIDALNIRAGGGLTHLKELINAIKHTSFTEIYVVGQKPIAVIQTSNLINVKIVKFNALEKIMYLISPAIVIKSKTKQFSYDILFSPAGTYYSKRRKYVSMSQNMLVFDETERRRFPIINRFRYILLELIQKRSFRNATANIFISNYAYEFISNKYPELYKKPHRIIYHGVSERFNNLPKPQKKIASYSSDTPFKILYTSIINYYKHQTNLISAIKMLVDNQYKLKLDLAGPMNPKMESRFNKLLFESRSFVNYHGQIPYDKIDALYKEADLFIFASTCENMPNILIEAMKAGLPILCSKYGPMPEILKDAGVYFDPLNPTDIADKLEYMLNDENLRNSLALKSHKIAKNFTWGDCAKQTFQFIENIHT
jgi:glycosyltransferase involved in cell wall biosynthesis